MVALKNLIACAVVLFFTIPAHSQGWYILNRDGSFNINGTHHRPSCDCELCERIRAYERKPEPIKPKEPPVPKDPESQNPPRPVSTPKLAVKTDTDKAAPTKEDVIKSIESNSNISASVKQEILANINKTSTQPVAPKFDVVTPMGLTNAEIISVPKIQPTPTTPNNSRFNLVEALGKNSKPAVKTDTDETPKPANPPRVPQPAAKQDAKAEPKAPLGLYEIPDTIIGVSVGSKVDLLQPWDISKPVPYGKLLQFWVKPPNVKPDKLKSTAYTWTVLPKDDVILWPDTTRIIFSSGTKHQTYVVMLTASYVFVDGENIVQKTAQAISMIQVGDGSSAGSPQTPPDLTGLAKQAFEWTSTVIRTDTYTEEMIKTDAKRLAAAFASIADKIDGDKLTDINAIIAATKIENDRILGENRNAWLPWFSRMTAILKTSYADNSISTPAQYSVAWRQIIKGLEAASK